MKTAHVLFFISLVGASSAFVFTSPLLPSSKNVYQTPLLLEAKEIVNEKERSENGVNAKTYGEIKDILLLNISPEEKAKLIARRIENEQDLTAKEVAKERNINRELTEKNKEVSMQKKSKISAVRDELRKILSISDPLEREDALVDLTMDKEKRAENAENLYREERLLNTNLTRTVESLYKDKEAKEKLLSGVKARGAIEYFEDYYGAEAVINKTEIKERYKSVDNENFEESTEERNRKTSNQAKTGEEGKGQTGNQVKTGKTGTYQERKQMRKEQAEKQKKAKARQIDARESNRRVREAKWLWIFQNRGWDVRVRKLREVIEKSNYSQINTVPKFCKAISEAYGDLSIWVVHRILYLEKTGDMYIADLTLGEESSSAVALLLSTINTKAPSKIDGRLL